MPLYEYECDACGHRFEVIQKFSDPLIEKCPKCGSPVHKLFSSPAIQFKGSGFYITDYPKKDHGAAAPTEGKSGAAEKSDPTDKKGDKGSATPSESAPATPTSTEKKD
jgi:putative FmdB family regulatory protein